MHVNDDLIDLFLETQALDRIPRMGFLIRGVADPETVSEHSWHVAFLVWVLAPQVADVDPLKAIELALVHDLAEVRVGDLPRTAADYFPPGAKQQAEAAALADLLAPLGERARRAFAEYQAGQSPEARLVKACDKLQLMLKVTAYERWGAGDLAAFWDHPANFPDLAIPAVRDLFDRLRERARAARDTPVATRG